MAMKIINFKKEGGRLKVNFRFEGLVPISYVFEFFEANSNDLVLNPAPRGNNLNSDDDSYPLPMPSQLNKGRIIMFHPSINALDEDADFNIIIEVIQENMVLDTLTHKGHIKKGGMTQKPMLIVKLNC
jgi:hypothetical protein